MTALLRPERFEATLDDFGFTNPSQMDQQIPADGSEYHGADAHELRDGSLHDGDLGQVVKRQRRNQARSRKRASRRTSACHTPDTSLSNVHTAGSPTY